MSADLEAYLIVASALFAVGFFGVLLRRNTLVILMSLELMLNASNLALVAFSRFNARAEAPMMDGYLFVFFIITVAAAEVAVGLAILVQLFRLRESVLLDAMGKLKN
jgi:NADH-quinone oxidoreductase subunit K